MLVKALRIFERRAKRPATEIDVDDKRTPEQARKEALDAVKEALNREVPPASATKPKP
jgi:hypothetical protein